MPRYKIIVEYNGTDMVGWQRQENGPSVQQYLEEAVESLAQETPEVVSAGRTDAGVHALGQVAHFDITKEFENYKIRDALNFHLRGKNIVVVSAEAVDKDFHARLSAKKRRYLYRILNRRSPPALRHNQVWHVAPPLNTEKMREAMKHLIGHHDFTTFRAIECQAKSPMKTLDSISIIEKDDEIHFMFEAKSFLHNMVRKMVGTLYMVGSGKWQPDDVKKALEAKDQSASGPTAPAHGLYFLEAVY